MRVHFLGMKLDSLTMKESIEKSISLIEKRNKQHVVLNASKVVMASNSPQLKRIINDCDLVNADGMAVVWAARLLGLPVPERVAGIDYMFGLMELAASMKLRVYLLGGTSAVVQATKEFFELRGVIIVGTRDGYWTKESEITVVKQVHDTRPDILFLAIPSPHKEFFLHTNIQDLNCGLVVGVGGSFDVIAGITKRAPRWMQRYGLEWLFRLIQEPGRMFRRYLQGNTKFVLLVLKELLLNHNLRGRVINK
jgi:N-acetylglucosaminyldiphosphoundecaprenol N-acetyl-beta-D-mannosaminyltransferase